uniref:Uncharacterized protein n=1 Tax=Rhizophora mucronata TaxID=61149 RepID=A0A2P2NN17_RHIMU
MLVSLVINYIKINFFFFFQPDSRLQPKQIENRENRIKKCKTSNCNQETFINLTKRWGF